MLIEVVVIELAKKYLSLHKNFQTLLRTKLVEFAMDSLSVY